MNIRQLDYITLLKKWTKGLLVDASYGVIAKELNISAVAAFYRAKTLEKHGWVKRKGGKLYLHPKFSEGDESSWEAI